MNTGISNLVRGQYPAYRVGLMLLVVLASLAALLGNDLVRSHEREYAIVRRDAYNLTGAIERHVKASTEKIDIVLREAVHDYTPVVSGARRADVATVNRDLLRREAVIPEAQAKSLRVIDAAGQVLFSAGDTAELPKVNVADRAYFLKQKNDPDAGLVLSEPILSRFTGKWLFTLSRRISHPDGSFAGLVQTALRADYFESGFKAIDVGQHGSIALFTSDFRLVSRHPAFEDQLGKSFDLREIRQGLQEGRTTGVYEAVSRVDRSTIRLYNYRKLDSLPLIVNVGAAPEDFLKGWKEKAWFYGLSLLVLTFELVALVFFQRRMNRRNLLLLEEKVAERTAELADSNERLRSAMRAAETANVAKSRFLATMSHELRTPMNGILGMAQLLRGPDVSAEERDDYARTILESGQVLLTLLNDILDLSKVEAGKLELKLAPFSPGRLVREVVALFAELARAKGIRLEAAWHGAPEAHYRGDAIRLRQMLGNLVSNAIKFTEHGSVRVDVRETADSDGRAVIEFAVGDTGIGIPADQQKLLFLPFSQADSSSTRAYGGTGLGLSIVRRLAGLMGGRIGVESREGEGSRFWFSIRAEPAAAPAAAMDGSGRQPAAAGDTAPRSRVMVVDDNATNRKVAEMMLKKHGFSVLGAEHGLAAVEAVIAGAAPALILMDCQMPVMDGYEATRRLRAWEAEHGRSRLPIVALTAGAFEEDRERCLAAGMDAFLTKPLSAAALGAVIERWLGGEPAVQTE